MGLCVLIVDDSSGARMVIERVVRLCDPEIERCFHAGNGDQAIAVLNREFVHVLFLDLHMPVMDGREVLKQIRLNEKWKNIVIAVVTSERSDETAAEVKQLGASFYLQKPVTPENVREVYELARENCR